MSRRRLEVHVTYDDQRLPRPPWCCVAVVVALVALAIVLALAR